VENMDSYHVIFLGYPNWWGTMPMPVFTFLEEYDFSGKTIIPFCTHEGSGMGRSEKDIAKLCPKATILKVRYSWLPCKCCEKGCYGLVE
jgi:flavodoxin